MGLIKFDYSKKISANSVLEMMDEVNNAQHVRRELQKWATDELAEKPAKVETKKKSVAQKVKDAVGS